MKNSRPGRPPIHAGLSPRTTGYNLHPDGFETVERWRIKHTPPSHFNRTGKLITRSEAMRQILRFVRAKMEESGW